MATFKCNHDIQFLLGGRNVSDRIHYCTKYVTKQQKRLDSVVVMALASFQRRQVREMQEDCDDEMHSNSRLTKSRKRVASMVYTMTSRQEVAGPLAALYIYRGSCCYESSRCSFVPLHDIVRQLCASEEYSCSLVNQSENDDESRFQVVSFLDDYIYRPDTLEAVNIYEFAMKFFRKNDEHPLTASNPFKSEHPLHHSHSLGKRYKEVIPVIQGFRLPFVTDSSPKAIRYKRAILSLVLFKSFRTLEDLIGSESDCEDQWLHSYDAWKNTCSAFVTTIMHHIDDYYCGEDRANARTTDEVNEPSSRPGVDSMCVSDVSDVDSDDSLFDGYDLEDDMKMDSPPDDDFVDPWNIATNTIVDTETLDPRKCPTSARPDSRTSCILELFKAHGMLERSALNTVEKLQTGSLQNHIPTVEDMRKWVQDSDTDNKLHDAPQSSTTVTVRDTEIVELLNEALEDASMTWWDSNGCQPTKLLPNRINFASVSDISRMFTLNQKQHLAFRMIGRALLSRWQHVEDLSYANSSNLSDALHEDQLRFFLGGEGGTGKSRVLDAVQALCTSWNRGDCLIKTALTGKAATMISGRTLASFLLQLKKKRRTSAIYLDILVIDEVSMMKKYQLAQLDKLLRSAKRVPAVPFGGIHVILVGDFLQLPPVGGEPLYKYPTGRNLQNANEIAGYQLWRTFASVVMLEESVRFQADAEWGHGCKYARKGIWLPAFVNLINSRISDASHTLDDCLVQDLPTFITPDNSTRLSINNLFISTTMNMMPVGEYPVRVVADFKGHLRKLGKTEVNMIMSLPDTKFGRMAPYLDLIIGMPIQITQNIRATKMAANGTLGTLEEIIYQPDTTFCVVYDSVGGFSVKIPSLSPAALIVRIQRGASAVSMKGCTDSDLFPLFSDARPFNQCDIKLAPSNAGIPRRLSLRIEQFPIVCAISSTVYKVQGETLNNMVVTEWRSENRLANKREQPYLLVSRVTSRFAFRTLKPLTDDIIKWARPSKEALEEDERLQELSDQMIQSWSQRG